MKKIILTTATLALLAFGSQANAQENSQSSEDRPAICGYQSPGAEWDQWFNEKVEAFKASRASMVNYTIPVIIHVIHAGEAVGTFPNLSNAQLVSQINVLNDDFAGAGLNVGNVPAVWKDLVANTGVSFCLARKDPKGNVLAEPGIERILFSSVNITDPKKVANSTNNATFLTYVDTKMKPATIWDPSKYLNIWVSERPVGGTGLGVANAPSGTGLNGLGNVTVGTATTDGLWCWGQCFGTTGTLATGYDKGRVSSHEIGHYLGLRHTWADASCGDDFCADTPPTQQANFNCPTFPTNKGTCTGNSTNGEMTMNIMDYTNDPCKYMFTKDQATRIQTAMANGTYRKTLGTHGLCESPLSVDQLNTAALDLIISPNPTSGNVDLTFRAFEAADVKIEINNLLGQIIATEFVKNPTGIIHQTVDLSNQNAGIYFVTIKYGSDRIVKKLVKQ
jgi:hypothetical protein